MSIPVPAAGGAPAPASAAVRASRAEPASVVAPGATRDASPGRALRLLATLAVIASLYVARDLLILLALAAFVAFLSAPLARVLERVRIPKSVAAVVAVLAFAAVLVGVLWASAAQAVDLARRLPEYRARLESKLSGLRAAGSASPIAEASDRWRELRGGLGTEPAAAKPPATPAAGAGAPGPATSGPVPPPAPAPVPVRVVEPEASPFGVLGGLVSTAAGPLGDAAVVILLAIFFLLYRGDVRERLLGIGAAHRIGVTSQAIEQAGKGVERYLLSNLAVNAAYGAAIGVGIAWIGLPSPWLWGLLCALLRFIPYIGTWIGAALPLALSIAVFDGWGRTGAVFAVILGVDIVVGNVVEPIVYGRRTGLSPLAVILATVFWTWLWGIAGLLLAVPLTLCLAVIGRLVPGFGLYHVLLGDEPILDAADRAYGQLLALDTPSVARLVAETTATRGAAAAYDDVLLAALRRAELDRRDGLLAEDRHRILADAVRDAAEEAGEPAAAAAVSSPAPTVLCLPAFSDADRVACELLVRLLAAGGTAAVVGPIAAEYETGTTPSVDADARTVCVASLPPFAGLRARHGLRRVRARHRGARLVGIVLDPEADRGRVGASLTAAGANDAAYTLASAAELLLVPPPGAGASEPDAPKVAVPPVRVR